MGLKEQCVIIKYIVDVCLTKDISSWQMLVKRLPVNIHNFCRRYLVMSLANYSNLKRWKISSSGVCLLSGKLQSQLHVFNNCTGALDRYTWRHNSVIKTLCNHLPEKVTHGFRLYADIKGCDNPATLFRPQQQNITATGPQEHSLLHRARPDVVIEIRDEIIVIELTCPFELNARKSREYKETRYKEIQGELLTPKSRFSLILLEVTSLGFVTENVKLFRNFLKTIEINETYAIGKMQEVAIRSSYYIYCRRNKVWNEPELISYQ